MVELELFDKFLDATAEERENLNDITESSRLRWGRALRRILDARAT